MKVEKNTGNYSSTKITKIHGVNPNRSYEVCIYIIVELNTISARPHLLEFKGQVWKSEKLKKDSKNSKSF